jgi:hypothetical protein
MPCSEYFVVQDQPKDVLDGIGRWIVLAENSASIKSRPVRRPRRLLILPLLPALFSALALTLLWPVRYCLLAVCLPSAAHLRPPSVLVDTLIILL